jgi:hypothetical protein
VTSALGEKIRYAGVHTRPEQARSAPGKHLPVLAGWRFGTVALRIGKSGMRDHNAHFSTVAAPSPRQAPARHLVPGTAKIRFPPASP